MRDPVVRACVAVALAVTGWTAIGAFARATEGARTTADEPQYLLTAISLGEDLDLDLTDEIRARRARDFHEIPMLVQAAARDDGSRVSPHDPALPALLALPVRAGGWLGAKLTLAAVAGVLAGATVWTAVRRFAVPLRPATVTVLALSAAAPLAVYATQVYPELPAALAVVGAIAAVTGPLDRRGLAVLVLAVVALPWLAVKYAPVAAVLAALAAGRLLRDRRSAAAGALGAALLLAGVAYLAAHRAWYGGWTVYASGSHFSGGELTVVGSDPNYVGRSIRIAGLLLDQAFGLAAWQPLYLLLPAALGALLVARPAGTAALVAPLLAGWATATWVALTMHGWWFPGRQVVHVLPAAALALAWLAAHRPALVRAYAVAGIAGASLFAWLVGEVLVGRITLVVTFADVAHPLAVLARATLGDYRALAAGDWARHGIWLVVLALSSLVAVRVERRRCAPVPRAPLDGPVPIPILEGAAR
jgi:hypothetical protein